MQLKSILSALLFLCFYWSSIAQENPTDIPSLTAHLTKNLTSNKDKVRIIHQWITNYIAYDYDALSNDEFSRYTPAEEILKEKKTLCSGYVTLMGAMLDEVNIEWHEVSGYTNKPYSYLEKEHYIDNHAWIAVKIDGQWLMADPTWDTGYIGAIPKKDKKPNVKKQLKQIEKIIQKNEKLEASGKETFEVPKLDTLVETIYSDKVGFVFDPSEDWFLVPLDSFHTRHLPASPVWQQRKTPIDVVTFYQGPEAVKAFTQKHPEKVTKDLTAKIDSFISLPFPDIYLIEGEQNFEFCRENARTKAIAYFNYLEVLNVPEIKKQFKQLPKYYERDVYKNMIIVADTAMKYAKIAENQEKERYRNVQKACANGNRNTERSALKFTNYTEKGLAWNDKAIEDIENQAETLVAGAEKMEKLKMSSSYFASSDRQDEIDLDAIPNLVSEFQILTDSLDKMFATFSYYQEHTVLQPIINTIQKTRYMLATRRDFLMQKQLVSYLFIDTLDAQIFREFDALDALYSDSLDASFIPRELSRTMMDISRFMKGLPNVLAERLSQGKIKQIEGYMDYFRKQAESYQSKSVAIHKTSLEYNAWMLGYLQQFENEWKAIEDLAKEQDKVAKKSNEHIVDFEEHNHKREMNLFQTIYEQSEKWHDSLDKRY